jgi:hypothetical protein
MKGNHLMQLNKLNGSSSSIHPINRVAVKRISNYFSQEKGPIDHFIQKSLSSFLNNVFIELTNGISWPKDKIRVVLSPETEQIQILELIYTKINVEVITETEDEDGFSSIDIKDDKTEEFRDITWVFEDAYKEYKKDIELEHLYSSFLKESPNFQDSEFVFHFFKQILEPRKKSDFEYSKMILEKLFTDKTLWSTVL